MSFGAGSAAGFGVGIDDDEARHVASHTQQSPNSPNSKLDHLSCQENLEKSIYLAKQTLQPPTAQYGEPQIDDRTDNMNTD